MDGAREQRLSFGSVAEAYDRSRPSYPERLVDDLVALLGGPASRIRALEVGAGTGKATILFGAAGMSVDALEPSAEMAAVARRRLLVLPEVTVIESEFEHWTREGEPYDLLISATAWHWIDPHRRYPLARAALRKGGVLCPFWNRPVWSECRLRDALGEAYARYAPELPRDSPMHPATRSPEPGWDGELDALAQFTALETLVYRWSIPYTAQQYTALLRTHSDYIMLDAEAQSRLLDAVRRVIDDAGGLLELPHITAATVARAQ